MSIGSRIEFIRGDLSRQDFGKRIGVGKTTVQNYETKDRVPTEHIIQKIREEFGVNVKWLLTGEGDPYLYGRAANGGREVSKGGEYNDQPVGLSQAEEQLARILNSDNQLIISNVLSTLQISEEALEGQKKGQDRIEQLEEECEDQKKRLSVLEEKCERLIEEIEGLRKGGVQDRRKSTVHNTMEFVSKVNDTIAESIDTKGNLEKILGHLLDLLKRVDRGAIVLLDKESMEISEIISRSKKPTENITDEFIRPIVELVKQGEAPLLIQNNEDVKGLSPTFELSNIGSLLCVPMINDESRVRGVFYIDSLDKPYGFRREDLTILTDLSKRAAKFIEHGTNAEPNPN